MPGETEPLGIREEEPADREAVGHVHRAAFGRDNEARLVDLLRQAAWPRLSLVAVESGQVVGHVFFSPVHIASAKRAASGPAPSVAGLAPLGVLPERQGRGIGSALVRGGLDRCAGMGWRAVVLVGNPAYYRRFGFVPAAPLGVRYESDHFDPVFQVCELEPGALRDCHGWARYHPAFEASGTG